MIVLGIHFGHDASISVLRDGQPIFVFEKERYSRVKYAIGIDADDVAYVLAECGLQPTDIDYCGITSTQTVEYFFFDPDRLSFTIGPNGVDALDCRYDFRSPAYQRYEPLGVIEWELANEASGAPMHFWKLFRQYWDRDLKSTAKQPPFEQFMWLERWREASTLAAIAAGDYSDMLSDDMRKSFHIPVTVNLFGHAIPGALLSHHLAHAANTFYESGFNDAAIITHDGGYDETGYLGGMFYLGRGTKLYPLTPHFLNLGPQYDAVSQFIGVGSSGKTMGLAAYGKPAFMQPELIGNIHDEPGSDIRRPDRFSAWCVERAATLGYDVSALAVASRMTEPINADIAATLQIMFEQTMLRAAGVLRDLLKRCDALSSNLCLSGGTSLNCPSNTALFNHTPFERIFVPPSCNDTGLSLGSAYFIYHSLLDQSRSTEPRTSASQAYLGSGYARTAALQAIEAAGAGFSYTDCADPERDAASMLAAGDVIGWFEGRSEIGPRALGHRSILANPTNGDNWRHVNEIKAREQWRPLAPMVLEEHAAAWFADAPVHSPHMLFNATVIGDRIPAIKHVDGTARVQTVTETDGRFYKVLVEFEALTGVPVLMNTSLNGPGEPIVQSPADALAFFAASALDALFIDGIKITRLSNA